MSWRPGKRTGTIANKIPFKHAFHAGEGGGFFEKFRVLNEGANGGFLVPEDLRASLIDKDGIPGEFRLAKNPDQFPGGFYAVDIGIVNPGRRHGGEAPIIAISSRRKA
jgi:hypothetical protein